VTQNVDGLHRAAGSRSVFEAHGSLNEVECLQCGRRAPAEEAEAQLRDGERIPRCPSCGAVLKPAVVLFGELLPPEYRRYAAEAESADVLLCLGSSLQVYPVAAIPLRVHERGCRVAVVNFGPTDVDRLADVRIDGLVGETLPCLVALLDAAGARG
jgi:NAD-dependent deacetylase